MTKQEFIQGIQRRAKQLKELGLIGVKRKPIKEYLPKPIVLEEISEEELEKELEKITLLEEEEEEKDKKDERDDNSI